MIKLLLTGLIAVVFTSCKLSDSKNVKDLQQFFVIDFETALRNSNAIKLSDIASSVQYISLETNSNCLIGPNPIYIVCDSLIIAYNFNKILAFDSAGNFHRQVGTPGNGPNEISLIRHVSVLNNKNSIMAQHNWNNRLLFFSSDGNYTKSILLPYDVFIVEPISENRFLFYNSCAYGFEDYLFLLTNPEWDTISTVGNHFKWENSTDITGMWGSSDFYPFYKFHKCTYVKSMFNDTIYEVNDEEIIPAYFIDLGKYRLPKELRPEPPQSAIRFRKESGNYFFANALEGGDWVFVTSHCYKGEDQKNILYNKRSYETVILIKEYGVASGFINDWDNGPEFWPKGSVDDNTLYMAVSPIKIKKLVESDEFKNATGNEEHKKVLTELAKNLKEDDNAVLMLVTLK